MPIFYLPMLIYAAMLEFVFRDWGQSEHRATIIASEAFPMLPAPQKTMELDAQVGL